MSLMSMPDPHYHGCIGYILRSVGLEVDCILLFVGRSVRACRLRKLQVVHLL